MKVKGIAISVITAMCILTLTVGMATAACGVFDIKGYVYDKDGVTKIPNPIANITNMNTNTTYTSCHFSGATDCVQYFSTGLYKLTKNRPLASPYDERACAFITGDVVKIEARNADGTQTNTTYHTMTDAYMIAAKVVLHIYLEEDVAEINFTKELPAGWNLISLPVDPSNHSTGAVLSSMVDKYDAVYSYNAVSNGWDSVLGGTMDPGKGYFVNVTTAGWWNYSGTAYTQMNVSLEPGLNLVGWLNTTKTIGESEGDALYSIKDKYWYSSLWNAAGHEYKAYNPHAPSVFNDFTEMERGTGYFISAKESGWLNESCS